MARCSWHGGTTSKRSARYHLAGGRGRGSVLQKVTLKLTFGSVTLVGIYSDGLWTRLPTG